MISPKERDSLTCLEELDSEDDTVIVTERMAEEEVLPFEQEVDHNMNDQSCKPLMSSSSLNFSTHLTEEDIIPPRCKTPTSANQLELEIKGSESDINELLNPITPTKSSTGEDPSESPWTPTANLKMLISAASPEIRNRERQKKKFNTKDSTHASRVNGKIRMGKKNRTKANKEDSFCDDLMIEEGGDLQMDTDSQSSHISRKEKSLGLLCHRFVYLYYSYSILFPKLINTCPNV